MKCRYILIVLFGLIALAVACGGEPEAAEVLPTVATETAVPTATETPTLTPTPQPTSTPTLTPSPAPTATPAPLTSKEVFDQVSPSVAYIETEIKGGSGILLQEGMILTSAHVVWPFNEARIIFPDGTEFENVPVANVDSLADLVVLGPIKTDVAPVELIAVEDLDIGSDVYLIGYPGEVDEYPQPSITRGLISRAREWEPIGVTYYQTDARIGGGQSGGMLVTEMGDVIGISSFQFSDAAFGLVASAKDILPRVQRLLAGEDIDGLQSRGLTEGKGPFAHSRLTIDNEWDAKTFVINEPAGTEVEITAKGERNDVGVQVCDAFGNIIVESDQSIEGDEYVSFETEIGGPYFVLVRKFFGHPIDPIRIESTSRLYQQVDLDDGKGMTSGKTIYGNLDHARDVDFYRLPLTEGDEINIHAGSIRIDPLLLIIRAGQNLEQLVGDDDSGGGMFGQDAEMSFIAPDSGNYLIIVMDSVGNGYGGYALEVREPYEGAPTPMVPQPTPEPVMTEFGAMAVYTSPYSDLAFLYPNNWTRAAARHGLWEVICSNTTDCFAGDDVLLSITEEDLNMLPTSTLEEFVDLLSDIAEEAGATILSTEDFETESGLSGIVLTIEYFDLYQAKRFIVVQDDLAFTMTYMRDSGNVEDLWPLAEFSFGSLVELK